MADKDRKRLFSKEQLRSLIQEENIPREVNMLEMGPMAVPYVFTRYCGKVSTLLSHIGRTMPIPSIAQAIPAPKVNHQAANPYWKANCAVPIVEAPPTRVPMIAPATTEEETLRPPVEKSAAVLTLLPA